MCLLKCLDILMILLFFEFIVTKIEKNAKSLKYYTLTCFQKEAIFLKQLDLLLSVLRIVLLF